MDQQTLNATITLEEVVDKEKKLSIKAHDGNRVFTYSIWKTKQDGSDSATYGQFKDMDLKVGSTVMIGYVIDEYETEINGFPKKVQELRRAMQDDPQSCRDREVQAFDVIGCPGFSSVRQVLSTGGAGINNSRKFPVAAFNDSAALCRSRCATSKLSLFILIDHKGLRLAHTVA